MMPETSQSLLRDQGRPSLELNGGNGGAAMGASLQPVSPTSPAENQPHVHRYSTGLGVPWHAHDWSPEELLQMLRAEQDNIRTLFDKPLKPDTHINTHVMAQPPVTFTFKDVSFAFTKPDGTRKTILEPVSGALEGGNLVALMGPSGCGKSTLLDMLAMKKTAAYTGEILVNGHPRDSLYQRIAAYVGQEDVMPQYWTVREAIVFNGRLKAPRMKNVPNEFVNRQVETVLSAFGLGHVADTFIGGAKVRGISGGQRRRVTLARGVSQRAMILFCDEPTSGLSATDAELCVKALRIIAKKFNTLILVVIHQPRVEVAELFDQLILLTSNPGRCVYFGPMSQALGYWTNCGFPVPQHSNPTDVYLDLVTPGGPLDHANEFVAFFQERLKPGIDAEVERKRQERGATVLQILQAWHQMQTEALMGPSPVRPKPLAVPFTTQVVILFQRKVTLTRRNPSSIYMPIGVPIVVGILMGVMYQGIGQKAFSQQLSFVFMLLTRICMGGMQQMPSLIEERTIMKYDASEALYGVGAFIVVGLSVDITLALIGAVANSVIMYAFSGLNWEYFGLILGWAVVNFFVFDSFFGFLAAASPTLQIAQVSAIPFNSIFMMFSGFMISKSSAPSYLQWIFAISPIGYAVQSIFVNMATDHPVEGPLVIKAYGFEDGQEVKGLLVMAGLVLFFRVLQVLALKYRNNIQK